jgi:pimeloyl-ACP methyl ester carboxylesterase
MPGTARPLGGLTPHDLAADVAAMIASTDAAPAHVARCLAADRPDLVRTLILLAAVGDAPPDPEAPATRPLILGTPMPAEEGLERLRRSVFSPRSDPHLWDTALHAHAGKSLHRDQGLSVGQCKPTASQ